MSLPLKGALRRSVSSRKANEIRSTGCGEQWASVPASHTHSPPEAMSVSPLMQRASSDARNTTGGPISSG
jgi:hypothetical protein